MGKFSELVGTATSGVIGPQGPQGLQGPQGTQGPQGPIGPAGPAVTASSLDRNELGGAQPLAVGSGGTGVSSLSDLQGIFGGLNVARVATSGVTLSYGYCYLVDSSGGALTVNLPPRNTSGRIRIVDVAGTFQTNNVTIMPATGAAINTLAINTGYVLSQKYGTTDIYNLDFYDTVYRIHEAPGIFRRVNKIATVEGISTTVQLQVTQTRVGNLVHLWMPSRNSLTKNGTSGYIRIPIDADFTPSQQMNHVGLAYVNGATTTSFWFVAANGFLSLSQSIGGNSFAANAANNGWPDFQMTYSI